MNAERIDEQLKSIQFKLQQVFKQYQQLKKENEQLKKELAKANEQTQAFSQSSVFSHTQLHQQLSDNQKAALEKKINTYLKEIDKCLALLNE